MKRSQQAVWILLITLVAAGGWVFAQRWLPRAELAESIFQVNLIRLQSWQFETRPTNLIVGSSLSGRLLPEYFAGTPLASIGDLGLDGSGPEFGLRMALASSNPPPRIFVEVHRLGLPWSPNDDTLLAAMNGPECTLARQIQGFRAETRPSTLLYAWWKNYRQPTNQPSLTQIPCLPPSSTPGWQHHFAAQVAELRQRGCEVILLRLPVGRENPPDPEARNEADQLAARLGLRLIDLNREVTRRRLELAYTDGLHLAFSSARLLSKLLVEAVSADPRAGMAGAAAFESASAPRSQN